jgi:hypothetical protein
MSFFQILKAKGIFLDYLIHGACAFPHVFSGKWTTEGEVMRCKFRLFLVAVASHLGIISVCRGSKFSNFDFRFGEFGRFAGISSWAMTDSPV